MSDLEGNDAFERVLDRLENAASERHEQKQKTFSAECRVRAIESALEAMTKDRDSWQRLAHQRNDEIGRLRSKLPGELQVAEPAPRPDCECIDPIRRPYTKDTCDKCSCTLRKSPAAGIEF